MYNDNVRWEHQKKPDARHMGTLYNLCNFCQSKIIFKQKVYLKNQLTVCVHVSGHSSFYSVDLVLCLANITLSLHLGQYLH